MEQVRTSNAVTLKELLGIDLFKNEIWDKKIRADYYYVDYYQNWTKINCGVVSLDKNFDDEVFTQALNRKLKPFGLMIVPGKNKLINYGNTIYNGEKLMDYTIYIKSINDTKDFIMPAIRSLLLKAFGRHLVNLDANIIHCSNMRLKKTGDIDLILDFHNKPTDTKINEIIASLKEAIQVKYPSLQFSIDSAIVPARVNGAYGLDRFNLKLVFKKINQKEKE
jgi:hypothetical protein